VTKKVHTRRDRVFGEIPQIEKRVTHGGREFVFYEDDPAYQPPLPKGAIRGDIRKQNYCRAHNRGKYFYVDEPRTCVQCGEEFVFSASEQRFWYETLGFHLDSQCIRCLKCRRQRRTIHALGVQVGNARQELRAKPDDPRALLELASGIVQQFERSGHGPLDEAVAAARKAAEVWPDSAEPWFWEAKAQKLAGRTKKAAPLFARFVDRARKVHRLTKLVAEAEEALRS
jgi:hypothetical protein